jgi:hypothetical protein
VVESLDVEVTPHMPAGSDGRRTTARAKGKVERPFRTQGRARDPLPLPPARDGRGGQPLARPLIRTYNLRDHRAEQHRRIDDWLAHLPAEGVRQMCAWERFCTFAREPERRLVGIDCRLTMAGVAYEVDAKVVGETVVVWWGLFDQELWVEHGDERFGPYHPVGGPIPLHRYRKHRKSRREARADRVGELAQQIALPRSALSGDDDVVLIGAGPSSPKQVSIRPFRGPDPFHELSFPTLLAAKRAIADEVRLPLGRLSDDDCRSIDALVARTLSLPEVLAAVHERFPQGRKGGVVSC